MASTVMSCSVSLSLPHRYQKLKNRLLKFCYVPATSAAHNRLLFFLFLLRPFTVLMKQTRQAVRAVKQSIFLDVYALPLAVQHKKLLVDMNLGENDQAYSSTWPSRPCQVWPMADCG